MFSKARFPLFVADSRRLSKIGENPKNEYHRVSYPALQGQRIMLAAMACVICQCSDAIESLTCRCDLWRTPGDEIVGYGKFFAFCGVFFKAA